MNPKVVKTIELIKKSYLQPLIFNTLINNLSHLMENCNPNYEITDDWSKILIYSVIHNRIPNQGLESKILIQLKKMRKNKTHSSYRLKLMIILYYLKNKKTKYTNHLIIFELVTNFIGIDDLFDGLIISILCTSINSDLFGLEPNKKCREDTTKHLLSTINNSKLIDINLFIALPCFIKYDVPFKLPDVYIQYDFQTFCKLEALCFFAKFCKNESILIDVMPKNELVLHALSSFINRKFIIQEESYETILQVEDNEIYRIIESAFAKSTNRGKFKSNLLEFITNLYI